MNIGMIVSVLSAIVVVGGVTVVVSSPNTASDIKAFGDSFASSLKAAMGR